MKEVKTMLNERQKRFVDFYIQNGGNATRAAFQAGYEEKTARQVGSRLLQNARVCLQEIKMI